MIARRQFLGGLGALAVAGFSPSARAWGTSAAPLGALDRIPRLDGELLTDPASLAEMSTDVGDMIHHVPIAVLRPGSVEDVQAMVKFCRRNRIKVGARGQGHTTFGQSQVEAGLVIDMRTLNTIHSITAGSADVDAGTEWKSILLAATPQGYTAPVLTGYTALTVGGTLSVGGISTTNAQGAQVDRVRALQVVTGDGQLVWCSLTHNRPLFEVCLAGLGQCAIIVRAILDLIPAKPLARTFALNYTDNATFFRDMRILLNRGEFNDVANFWFPLPGGGWLYQLNATSFHDPANPPDGNHLLRGLSQPPSAATISDNTYLNYVLRIDFFVAQLQAAHLWEGFMHPWFDVFLPDATVERYIGEVMPTLTPEDVGFAGLALMLPQRNSKLNRKFLRVPRFGEWVFLFDILTSANTPGPNPEFETRMLARNRRLFEKARRMGGTRYPIGSLEFSKADWILHYAETHPELAILKRIHDPACILTPGPGIF